MCITVINVCGVLCVQDVLVFGGGGGGGGGVFVHGCDWRERAWRVCTLSVYHSWQEYITWEYKYSAGQ